ncbi:MAG: putative nucleotidyltransferase [Ignavibacteria bacterium]|nr:putative nucleotidyltransferase [Ignavibacteria bacterium]
MAEIKSEIIEKVRKYLELVESRGIKVDSAYIFGSYSTGKYDEWSDIDLAIISESFSGKLLIDIEKILGLARKVDSRISALPMNFESLNSPFLQSEVLGKGYRVV